MYSLRRKGINSHCVGLVRQEYSNYQNGQHMIMMHKSDHLLMKQIT